MKKYGSLHCKDQIFCQTLEPGIAGKFRPSFDLESPKIEAYNPLCLSLLNLLREVDEADVLDVHSGSVEVVYQI